jgi:hypothetical protein
MPQFIFLFTGSFEYAYGQRNGRYFFEQSESLFSFVCFLQKKSKDSTFNKIKSEVKPTQRKITSCEQLFIF